MPPSSIGCSRSPSWRHWTATETASTASPGTPRVSPLCCPELVMDRYTTSWRYYTDFRDNSIRNDLHTNLYNQHPSFNGVLVVAKFKTLDVLSFNLDHEWWLTFSRIAHALCFFMIGKALEPEQAGMSANDPSAWRLRQGNMLTLLWNFVFHGTSARFPGTVSVRLSICRSFWSLKFICIYLLFWHNMSYPSQEVLFRISCGR